MQLHLHGPQKLQQALRKALLQFQTTTFIITMEVAKMIKGQGNGDKVISLTCFLV